MMINDLPDAINQLCVMFVDDTNIGRNSLHYNKTQNDLFDIDAWVGRNKMLIIVIQMQHINIREFPLLLSHMLNVERNFSVLFNDPSCQQGIRMRLLLKQTKC